MRRIAQRLVVAAGLAGAAWGLGHAQGQAQEPGFVVQIVAPGGTTTLECVTGCTFRSVRIAADGTRSVTDTPRFTQGCQNDTCEIDASGVGTGKEPGFILRIVAPGGRTSVECVRGSMFNEAKVFLDATKRNFQVPRFQHGCKGQTCEWTAGASITR
jgi:hypothetical protein